MNFWEFAGQHPIITVLLSMLLVHMPVAIIKALKNTDTDDRIL